MIVYLDASALVKRHVDEAHFEAVHALVTGATAVSTAAISGAEVPAAIAKAARMALVTRAEAEAAYQAFQADWDYLIRLQVTEALVRRAASLAWEQVLRGFDAVHLAAALLWAETTGEPVHLATFDRQLWHAAHTCGLFPWPATAP
jgi:predicted nucleic acid-binding protein